MFFFKNKTLVKVWVLTNGVRSNPSSIQVDGSVAQVLNLVIKFKEGAVDAMDWKNTCIPEKCEFVNCKELK